MALAVSSSCGWQKISKCEWQYLADEIDKT